MMSVTAWGPLTVNVFFKDYNWSGQPAKFQSTETASENLEKTSWLCLNLQEFFNQNNWRGQPIVSPSSNRQATTTPISLIMPVGQFFQLAVWKELSIATVTTVASKPLSKPEISLLDSSDSKYNLNDFSDLF